MAMAHYTIFDSYLSLLIREFGIFMIKAYMEPHPLGVPQGSILEPLLFLLIFVMLVPL